MRWESHDVFVNYFNVISCSSCHDVIIDMIKQVPDMAKPVFNLVCVG